MDGKYTYKSAPKPARCHSCARPMQLVRRTSRYGGLPDLYSVYCVACDEWQGVGGTLLQPARFRQASGVGDGFAAP